MQGATEYVLTTQPFVVRRRARWSECDPAGVVYTGRFVDYLLSAVALFNEHLSGESMETAKKKLQIQTPCKGLSLVFDGALWPNNEFDMHVTISAIRSSSFDISVRAVRPTGEPVFSGVVSPICIALTERRAVPIPDELRQRFEAAMSAAQA
jgi:4-hydroxybenzoyl-CoA thioesterase